MSRALGLALLLVAGCNDRAPVTKAKTTDAGERAAITKADADVRAAEQSTSGAVAPAR